MTDEQYRLCEREEGIIPWTEHEFYTELGREFFDGHTEKWDHLWANLILTGSAMTIPPRVRVVRGVFTVDKDDANDD